MPRVEMKSRHGIRLQYSSKAIGNCEVIHSALLGASVGTDVWMLQSTGILHWSCCIVGGREMTRL